MLDLKESVSSVEAFRITPGLSSEELIETLMRLSGHSECMSFGKTSRRSCGRKADPAERVLSKFQRYEPFRATRRGRRHFSQPGSGWLLTVWARNGCDIAIETLKRQTINQRRNLHHLVHGTGSIHQYTMPTELVERMPRPMLPYGTRG